MLQEIDYSPSYDVFSRTLRSQGHQGARQVPLREDAGSYGQREWLR